MLPSFIGGFRVLEVSAFRIGAGCCGLLCFGD